MQTILRTVHAPRKTFPVLAFALVLASLGFLALAFPQSGAAACTLSSTEARQKRAEGKITTTLNGSAGTASVTNKTRCVLPVSLASYEMFTDTLQPGTQRLFDATDLVRVAPSRSAELRVQVPKCNYQIDLWYGPAPTPQTALGPHVLKGQLVYTTAGFCPLSPPTPEPSPLPSPTPTPTVTTTVNVEQEQTTVVNVEAKEEKREQQAVRVSKTDDRETAKPGQVLVYRLVVRNPNDDDLTEVKLVDHVPPYLVPLAIPSGARADVKSRTITWSNQTISAEAEVTFSFRARVTTDAPHDFLLQNVVDVSGPGLRESATDTTRVVAPKVAAAVAPQRRPVPVTAPTGTPLQTLAVLLSLSGGIATAGTLLVRRFV